MDKLDKSNIAEASQDDCLLGLRPDGSVYVYIPEADDEDYISDEGILICALAIKLKEDEEFKKELMVFVNNQLALDELKEGLNNA